MAGASFASTAAARDPSSSSSSAVTAVASPGSSSPRSRRPLAPPDPYDDAPRRTSPLPPPDPLSYASGGGAEPGFEDEGDLGARAISRADKGKGRAQRQGEGYGRVAGRDARDGQGPEALEREGEGAGAGDGEADEVDEAAEERKVQENLARWSRAEQKRRASIRRSSQFVTPSLPPIPSAPPVPSASTIMRRTSTLVRKASRGRRRRKGASVVGLGLGDGEELELSGEIQGDGVAARRGRRKLSVKIAQGRDGSRERSSVVALSEVGEAPPNELEVDDGDEDTLPTPTASTMTTPNLFSSVASSTTTAPAPSNASFVSLSCTTSRFVEDLPPPLSATSSRVSLQLQSGTPLSPTSPTAASRANPFSDAVVTSPPAPPAPHSPPPPPPPRPSSASEIEIDLTPRSSGARPPGPRSRPSQQSVQTFASSTVAPSYYEWPDEPAARPLASAAAPAAGAGAGAGAYDSRTSSPMSPAFRSDGRLQMRRRAGDDGFEDDEEEEEEEEAPTVGLLDWLLCGCFRPQGWDRPRGQGGAERYEQQEGRTNPME
ncbi:hypothetical protein JCM5296_001977 [Sporobolomyces johnsonii]